MLTDGINYGCGVNAYAWNAEEQMSCAAGSAYTYDGDGSRVEKTGGGATPTLYWDGLAESDLSGNVTSEYIFLGGRRIARRDVATGSVYYYFQDMLNSSNVVATSAGGVENESDFYPFDYSYKTSGTTTTVTDTLTSADVNLSVTITLPTWDGYSSASPAEQKQWDSLAGGLKEHEDGHKTIAEQGAAALDKSLPGTTGTGTGNSLPGAQKSADAALGQQVSDKHQDAVTTTQKNQDSYDSRTNHGAQPDPQKKPN